MGCRPANQPHAQAPKQDDNQADPRKAFSAPNDRQASQRQESYRVGLDVQEAAVHGAYSVELNMEPSAGRSVFDEAVQAPATEAVPAFVDRVLARIAT